MTVHESSSPRSALLTSYYPALDGLRAVALLLVFAVHFGASESSWVPLRWGWCGVDVFFVLSGFLITGILWDSLDRSDYFRNFYTRRTLRIFPLYYSIWLVVLLFGILPSAHVFWDRYNLTYLVYLANFFQPGGLLGHHTDVSSITFLFHHSPHLHHVHVSTLWSLCVEEQFYLVWPAVVFLVRSRRKLMTICAAVIVLEPFARVAFLHWHPEMLGAGGTYFLTFFRIDTLLIGGFVALWLRDTSITPAVSRRISYVLLAASLSLLYLGWKGESGAHAQEIYQDWMIATFGFTFVALAAAAILLLALDSTTVISRVLQNPIFVWIGRISYGMYVFHGFVLFFLMERVPLLHRLHLPEKSIILIGPLITTAVAWLSFRYLESPFLRLKPKLAPRHGAADDPPPFLQPQHSEL